MRGCARPQAVSSRRRLQPDHLVLAYLKRLAATGAAYTASSVIAKLIAVALLPLYTRHLTRADYGAAEVLLATVVALSILVRLGIVEALLRFYFSYDDRREREDVVRTSFAFLLLTSTTGAPVLCRRPCSTGATRT
jgi:O-antigen/teichoic acid export membrane protein